MRSRRILLTLLIVFALLLGGGAALLWSGRLHARVRSQLIASAGVSLDREVAVGRVRGDPWRGVVIEDLAVARTDRISEGVMIRARRAEIRFDVPALARDLLSGRGVLPSIRQITLIQPSLLLEVSRQGRWNVLDLLRGQPPTEANVFAPLVEIREGSADFTDAFGLARPFTARFARIEGTVDLRAWPRVRVNAALVSLRGPQATPLTARGTYLAGVDALDLDVAATRAPLAQWGHYFVRTPGFLLDRGEADAAFHILRTRWSGRRTLDYRGTLRLYDAEALLEPQRTRLRDARGVIEVDNLRVRSEDLALSVEGSPLRLRGEMVSTARGRRLDLWAASEEMDLATLRRLLFPGSQLALAGHTGAEVRITGPLQTLTVEGALYDARGAINAQPFTIAASGVTLAGDLLALDGLTGTAGEARLAGEVRHLLGTAELLVAGEARQLTAQVWRRAGIPLSLPLEGRLDGTLALGRTGDRLVVEAALAMGRGDAGGLAVDGLRAGGWIEDGEIFLPYLVAARGSARVHASGAISQSGRLAMDVAAEDLDLGRISALVRLAPRLTGMADGSGRLEGSLAAPVFTGEVVVGRGRFGALTFDGAEGPIRLTRQSVASAGLLVRDGLGRYQVSGGARWGRSASALDLTVDADEIAAAGLVRDAGLGLDLTGRISGRIHIGGTPARPRAEGTLSLADGRVEGQRVDEATAAFRWADETLHLDRVQARVRDSQVLAHGTVRRGGETALIVSAPQFDLRNLTILPPQLLAASGRVDLAGRISGRGGLTRIAATLASSDLTLNGQRFDHAEGVVRWEQGRLHLEPLTLRQGEGRYTVTGALHLRTPLAFDLRGDVAGGRLSTLLALGGVRPRVRLDGRLDGTVRVEGTPARPSASLDVRLSGGRLGDHPIEEGQAVLRVRGDVISIDRLRLRSGAGEIAAQGHLALRGVSALEVAGTNLHLDLLRPLLGFTRPLRGTLNFTTQFSGPLSDPDLGLSLEVRDGGIDGLTFDSLVANAFYKEGQFHIEQALVVEGENRVKGTGTIPFNPATRSLSERPMRFEISLVEANLGLLALLTPQVQEASGRLEGQVTLSGTPRRPEMSGRLAVRGGRIKLRSVTTPLEEIRADLSFGEDRLTLESFSARMGAGTLSATGAVVVADFRPARIERLTVRARDARLEVKPLFAGEVDADLTFSGPLRDANTPPEIAGAVTLKRGDLVIGAAPGGSGWRGPDFRLREVRLRGGEDLAVHVGRLRIDLKEGEVIAGGTLRRPALDGEWVADRGTMTVFGQTFLLREGRARFLPQLGLTPIVSLEAETQVGAVRVFIEVHQSLPHEMADRLILRSDPPRSREEIVRLLAQQSGLPHLLAGDVQAALRVELSRALFGEIGQTVARALGLSEFVIQYDFQQPLSLRIGRLLVRDLYLTLTTVFESPRTRFVWALEWRFARNLMLTLSLDNAGRADALLLYTIRF